MESMLKSISQSLNLYHGRRSWASDVMLELEGNGNELFYENLNELFNNKDEEVIMSKEKSTYKMEYISTLVSKIKNKNAEYNKFIDKYKDYVSKGFVDSNELVKMYDTLADIHSNIMSNMTKIFKYLSKMNKDIEDITLDNKGIFSCLNEPESKGIYDGAILSSSIRVNNITKDLSTLSKDILVSYEMLKSEE